jgi:GNAT superfamily N-acetyltransferase
MAVDNWGIERLGAHHDRSSFDCGQESLNYWLKSNSGQFNRRDLARTYVAIRPDEPRVFGYYALSTHHIRYEELAASEARGLPRIDVPMILIGRLAVDKSEQGKGLGEFLLLNALHRCERVSDEIGVRGVEVDAIDESARRFYLKYGFIELLDDPHHLILSLVTIRKLRLGDDD